MLSVALFNVMLNVVLQNVDMLSVVAPIKQPQACRFKTWAKD
jgi:hypothetical protein